jgi:predicted helicase
MKTKAAAQSVSQPKPEKPLAKRNNPEYSQVSAYLPDKLYNNVIIALRTDGKKRGFSDLLEKLLSDWMKKRG